MSLIEFAALAHAELDDAGVTTVLQHRLPLAYDSGLRCFAALTLKG